MQWSRISNSPNPPYPSEAEEAFRDTYLDPFLDACMEGDVPKIQKIIATGQLSVEHLNQGLTIATEGPVPSIVSLLFDAGACLCVEAWSGLGFSNQLPSTIRQFLDRGLDPDARDSWGGPLLCSMSNPECARELLLRGADPNLSGPSHKTPLTHAFESDRYGNTDLPELLLEYGARLEPHLLFTAVGSRSLRRNTAYDATFKTKFLLDKGLDPNTTSELWGTALHLAAYGSKPNIVKVLLDAGADPLAQAPATSKFPGLTPAQVARHSWYSEFTLATLRLLEPYENFTTSG